MADQQKESQVQTAQPQEAVVEKTLLDRIIEEGRLARDESQREYARDLIGEFVKQVMAGQVVVSKDLIRAINARIAQVDKLISAQLNEIMHHPDLQKLEASWRGLSYLVFKSETGTDLKIRVMNVSKADLLNDMKNALEFDQSALFKKIYEEEFGMFGGASYGALVGDYEFSNHPEDVTLLKMIAEVASQAHAPFIAAAAPQLFNLDSFTEMPTPRDLAMIFQGNDYAAWRSFRESEDSRYVALVLPHVLMRLPYGAANVPVQSFNYEEDVDGATHDKYLWGNAAYALASRLTDAFAKYHWTAAIRGVEGGGWCRDCRPTLSRPTKGT